MLPEKLEIFLKEIHGYLFQCIQQVIGLFRWRYGIGGDQSNPFSHYFLDWSWNGQEWYHLVSPIHGVIRVETFHQFHDSFREFVVSEVQKGSFAPLAHDLLREANEHKHSNPRSAVLLGIAAAEIGVKHCISDLVPMAEYLVETSFTPPIADLIKNYLPQLPTRLTINGFVVELPKDQRRVIDQGVQTRNKTAHRPKASRELDEPLLRENVETLLEAVSDLLWLLDYYCGYDWALNFVSDETRAGLEALTQQGKP